MRDLWRSLKGNSYILIVALCLTLISCTSTGKDSTLKPASSPKRPVSTTEKSLAPGTAKVTAEVLTRTEKERFYVCSFRIKTVHGYGSATPPLPPGTEIKVAISKTLLEKSSRTPSEFLKNGNTLKMTLSYRENLLIKKALPSWRVIVFHKK